MDEQQRKFESTSPSDTCSASGSAWAELDDTFFRIVADLFPRSFCAGASALLSSNDKDTLEDAAADAAADAAENADVVIEIPEARLSHEDKLARINQEIDRELALRRAMRRHPSRRRF